MKSTLAVLVAMGLAVTALPAEHDPSPALRQLAERYYAALAAKDLPAVVALWDPDAPDLRRRRTAWLRSFANDAGTEIGPLVVHHIRPEGEAWRVEVVLELTAVEADARRARDVGPQRRVLVCVRREGEWKLSRDLAAEDELAQALLVAGSDEARSALLDEHPHAPAELIRALVQLAQDRQAEGQSDSARTALRLAEAQAERGAVRADLARVFDALGTFERGKGDDGAALEQYQRSLTEARASGDVIAEAATLENASQAQLRRGEYQAARAGLEQSLALRRGVGQDHAAGGAFAALGRLNQQQGDFDEAVGHYQEALKRANAIEDALLAANVLNGLGGVEHERGNYGRALEHYELALVQAQGHKAITARTLNNMGLAQRLQGRRDLAGGLLARALVLWEQLGDTAGQAVTLLNIGMAMEDDPERALECYGRALALHEAGGNRAGVALVLNSMGALQMSQGRTALALEHLTRSLALSEQLGNKARIVQTLANVAKLQQDLGAHEAALATARRAVDLARELGHAESVLSALTTAGQELRALGRREEARQAFEQAVEVLEEMRSSAGATPEEQQRFLESRVSPYADLAELLIAEAALPAALAQAERAKARVLLDVLRSGRADVSKALSPEERSHEQALQQRLADASAALRRERRRGPPGLASAQAEQQQARLAYESYRTRLFAAHPELRTQRGEPRTFDWSDATALIPDDVTVAIEFLVRREASYVFVLTRPRRGEAASDASAVQVKVHRLPLEAEELERQVADFRARLAARELSVGEQARALFAQLLGPARADLEGRETLVIVPDGPLWELPFQALQPRSGRYLIEDLAISYAPSLTVLREMRRAERRAPRAGPPRLLAFGNPAPAGSSGPTATTLGQGLGPLPEAERQVEQLRRLYGPKRSTVYVGSAAREERLAHASGYDVLHLATHGVLDDRQPMHSYLLMAPGGAGGQDGLLEAREIMDLDLDADLVVLAACETGRGRVGDGEGLIGLVWSVFVAGSPTSVVSLWRVDAASTTELMVEFHRSLLRTRPSASGARGTAQALRGAALRLLRAPEYRHPFYWAGFSAIGDAR